MTVRKSENSVLVTFAIAKSAICNHKHNYIKYAVNVTTSVTSYTRIEQCHKHFPLNVPANTDYLIFPLMMLGFICTYYLQVLTLRHNCMCTISTYHNVMALLHVFNIYLSWRRGTFNSSTYLDIAATSL